MLLSLVSTFGTVSITANAVTGAIVSIQCIPGNVLGMAMMTVVAQSVGAGDYPQAKYYTRKLMTLAYVFFTAWALVMWLLLPVILHIYQLSPETTALTQTIATMHIFTSIAIWAPAFILPNTLRAAGDVKYPMTVSILSMCLVRIVFAYILSLYFHMGVIGTWVAMFFDWGVRAVLFIVRYLHGKWMNYRVV